MQKKLTSFVNDLTKKLSPGELSSMAMYALFFVSSKGEKDKISLQSARNLFHTLSRGRPQEFKEMFAKAAMDVEKFSESFLDNLIHNLINPGILYFP